MEQRFVVSAHRTLSVSPEEVWALTSDTSRYAEWVTDVRSVTTHHGSARAGGVYTEEVAALGRFTSRVTWTVRQLEANRLRVDLGQGFAPLTNVANVFRFAPLSGGTSTAMTFEFWFDVSPSWAGRLVRPIATAGMSARFDVSMCTLEALILSERTVTIR
ncbi:SRPBCC family protein [Rhodococcus ruber]|uniref:SRPBCC family protein n=1 Tax=Rhodococcus ruber TaxID=1830 RepID=A0ABT4MIC5_9NOCA|nr:SRPBCC family protein [Rhodococcus ruber]MCZ4520180.1 SRPBCC family protein [Rhodococcus ruber]